MRTQKIQTRSPASSADATVDVAGAVAANPTGSESAAKHTRTSGAWAAITIGLLTFVGVLAFALQNLRSVQVSFFSLHGDLPLVILLLLAAAAGALIVFGFGAARIAQLRVAARRTRRRPSKVVTLP